MHSNAFNLMLLNESIISNWFVHLIRSAPIRASITIIIIINWFGDSPKTTKKVQEFWIKILIQRNKPICYLMNWLNSIKPINRRSIVLLAASCAADCEICREKNLDRSWISRLPSGSEFLDRPKRLLVGRPVSKKRTFVCETAQNQVRLTNNVWPFNEYSNSSLELNLELKFRIKISNWSSDRVSIVRLIVTFNLFEYIKIFFD